MTVTEPARAPEPATPRSPILEVDDLSVTFGTATGPVTVVDGVGFSVAPGETLGIVGESGSGKSVTSLAIMGLIPPRAARVRAKTLRFAGRDLNAISRAEMRALRGSELSMVFQEPMTSLNPAYTIGNQIAETVRAHQKVSRREAKVRAVEMLDQVGIPDPHRRVKDYPHAFSGGMRQRAMIAMALSCDPKLLIADEPTTALDVTIQAQILDLLRSLQAERDMAVVFVTHDLGVVAEICDRVIVMYAGQIVEQSEVSDLFARPRHPYTEGLLDSLPQTAAPGDPLPVIPGQVPRPGALPPGCRFGPRCGYTREVCTATQALVPVGASLARCVRHGELTLAGTRAAAMVAEPADDGVGEVSQSQDPALLSVTGLAKGFPVRSAVLRRTVGQVRAVDGIDFSVAAGETLGLVGESGSGKSTVARLVLRLIEPTSGTVALDGADITKMAGRALKASRRDMQIVFQDPYSSLDPRATVAETVGEPLEVHLRMRGRARDERVGELLTQVGLDPRLMQRYPHEFSGGQRQRIALARALALEPKLLVLDEPVSSLDVSTQSQVVNLLSELQERLGLSYLFIAHDLSVVRHISDRIAVMYLGRIVEQGPAAEVYERPRHPYTEALLSAIPVPDPAALAARRRIVLTGDVPSPLTPPSGCRFHPRCADVMEICRSIDPPETVTESGVKIACHLHTSGPTLAGAPLATLRPREQQQSDRAAAGREKRGNNT